ncbi:cell wall hydrolase [Sphingomonas chungangi]|uniref:cell wall hydrolase n=1 Tax=Sphingomonas chungangi TaxID=2683589 RepID=UPI001C674C58|nr:cell wall hydrolase [Sphingomonas chungangi]
MYRLSSLGLAVLMSVTSCVPPETLAPYPVAEAAHPAPKAAHWVSPGTILAAMPEMPVAPPPPPGEAPAPIEGAPSFVAQEQSADDASRALDCLTAAVYYEARSESDDGQRAVAQVVLNRVRNPAFPGSVCGVVYQGSYRTTGCQFSFTCDGSLAHRREPGAWEHAREVASAALSGDVYAPIGAAMYYHTTAVHPYWEDSLTPVTTIGAHIFYRWSNALDNSFEFRQRYAGIEPVGAGQSGWDDARAVLVRYGTTESAGVMVHRGGATETDVASSTGGIDPSQPATLATIAGVTIHTGGGMASGGNAPGVRLHYGNGASKPVEAAVSAAETADAAPAPDAPAADAATSQPTSAARD